MSDLLLTPEEVHEATGAIKRAKQMAWFLGHGIPAELGTDRRVKVLRAAYVAKMMPGTGRHKAKTEPRLDLIRKAG
jgi:hypothetical protein